MKVVLDTSVMIDCLLGDRSRHATAVLMARRLADEGHEVLTPMHGFFEVVSAVACERRVRGQPLRTGELGDGFPFTQTFLPIDNDFLKEYLFDAGVFIDLKSGDMIMVAVAMKRRATLITEDDKMTRVAKKLGVNVSSIREFLGLDNPPLQSDERIGRPLNGTSLGDRGGATRGQGDGDRGKHAFGEGKQSI